MPPNKQRYDDGTRSGQEMRRLPCRPSRHLHHACGLQPRLHGRHDRVKVIATSGNTPATRHPNSGRRAVLDDGPPAVQINGGSPAPGPLPVAPVTAFGPDGSSDGDNPDIASQIVDVNASQPWCSDRATAGDDPSRRPVRAGPVHQTASQRGGSSPTWCATTCPRRVRRLHASRASLRRRVIGLRRLR